MGYSPWGHKRVGQNLVTKQPQQYISCSICVCYITVISQITVFLNQNCSFSAECQVFRRLILVKEMELDQFCTARNHVKT